MSSDHGDVHYHHGDFVAAQREEFDEDEAQRAMEIAAEQADEHRGEAPSDWDADRLLSRFDPVAAEDQTLRSSVTSLINMVSRENRSNTPDFALASFVMAALQAFEDATNLRDGWYGMKPEPGMVPKLPVAPNSHGLADADHGLRYRIWSQSHMAWWRHGAMGYTFDLADAGVFSHAETVKHVMQSANHGLPQRVSVPVVINPTPMVRLDRTTEPVVLELPLQFVPAMVHIHSHVDHVDVVLGGTDGGPVGFTPDEAEQTARALFAAAEVCRAMQQQVQG